MKVPAEKLKQLQVLIDELPVYARPAAQEVVRKMVAAHERGEIEKIDINQMFQEFSTAIDKTVETIKPEKIIKIPPRVAKVVNAEEAWVAKMRKEADQLVKEVERIEKRRAEIKSEASMRHEKMHALVRVELGISSRKAYRINHKKMQVEIIGDQAKPLSV